MRTRRIAVCSLAAALLAACGAGAPPEETLDASEVLRARDRIAVAAEPCAPVRILEVPAEYPTLGAALAAARPGDGVRAAPGTYAECLALPDGVVLEGRPGAILDGSGCGPEATGVVRAGAEVTHGAAVKGFTIVESGRPGVHLGGAKGVRLQGLVIHAASAQPPRAIWLDAATGAHVAGCRLEGGGIGLHAGSTAVLSDLDIRGTLGTAVLAAQSSFVLERSRITGSGTTASVRINRGSTAVLVGNDVQGAAGDGVRVQAGEPPNDPLAAPSKAWLSGNSLRGNGWSGLLVSGKGSRALGVGNRYAGNQRHGIAVSGGAAYAGTGDEMTDNGMNGLWALGCELACPSPGCGVNLARSEVAMEAATIDGNQGGGAFAGCGAQLAVHRSLVARSGGTGIAVSDRFAFDPDRLGTGPSSLRARDTVFKGNGRWGTRAAGGVALELGTADAPGRNSFLENGLGSISSGSPGPVPAQGNWFGTTDPEAIAASIWDCADDPTLGCVQYVPYLKKAPFKQVAAPTFSPPGGTYGTDQAVVLRSATPGATLHYTTDGTTPTDRSPAYRAPIPVAGMGTTVTIRAVATRKGMLDSDVASATYTIKVLSSHAFVPLPGSPNDVVYDPSRGRAYVSNRTLNRIEVVNVETGEVAAPIPVGGSPRGLAVTPDGRSLLATLFDTCQMAVVDLDARAQVSAIDLPAPGGGCPTGPLRVDFDAAGTCVWRDATQSHAFGRAYVLDLGTGASSPWLPAETEMLRYAPSFDRSRFLLMFNWGRASVWSAASQGASPPVPVPGFSGDWWNWMNQGAITNSGELILLSSAGAAKAYDAGFGLLGSIPDIAWGTFGPWTHLALVVPGSDERPSDTVSLVDLRTFRTVDSLVLPELVGYGEFNFGGQPIFLTPDAKQLLVVGQTGLFVVDTSGVSE